MGVMPRRERRDETRRRSGVGGVGQCGWDGCFFYLFVCVLCVMLCCVVLLCVNKSIDWKAANT